MQGYNNYGQLGDNTVTSHYTPAPLIYGGLWSKVALGANFGCGVRSDFSIWCWVSAAAATRILLLMPTPHLVSPACGPFILQGYNGYGQLGDGTATNRLLPTKVPSRFNFTTVSCAELSACALKSDGYLLCWVCLVGGRLCEDHAIMLDCDVPG